MPPPLPLLDFKPSRHNDTSRAPHQRLLEYCIAGASLTSAEVDQCALFLDIGLQMIHDRAVALICKRQGEPLLISRSADGTPMTTRERYRGSNVSGPQPVNRAGRKLTEFFLSCSVFLGEGICKLPCARTPSYGYFPFLQGLPGFLCLNLRHFL